MTKTRNQGKYGIGVHIFPPAARQLCQRHPTNIVVLQLDKYRKNRLKLETTGTPRKQIRRSPRCTIVGCVQSKGVQLRNSSIDFRCCDTKEHFTASTPGTFHMRASQGSRRRVRRWWNNLGPQADRKTLRAPAGEADQGKRKKVVLSSLEST